MNIVLIGASGFIGSAILLEALDRDHEVKGVVRHPEKIKAESQKLQKIKGDISIPGTVEKICKNADVVISAYNPGWTNPNIAEDTLKNYPIILEGVKAAGVKRFLVVGGAGSLFVSAGLRMMDSGIMPEAYLPAVRALARFYLETLTAETAVDWVFFSPANEIFPGNRTGKFRLGKDEMIIDSEKKSRISREDYSVAMLDEAESPAHHRERFTIGY